MICKQESKLFPRALAIRFPVKVDWGRGAAMVGLAAALTGSLAQEYPWLCAVTVGQMALYFAMCYPQFCETTNDDVIVHAGFLKRRVPYHAMTAVRLSSAGIKSLSSTDRVQILYRGSRGIFIAPVERLLFIAEVARHTPQLTKAGEELETIYA